jgi:hypothetical protein
MSEETNSLPVLACPNCDANILENGFYNYCIESVSLREDNETKVANGRVYLDHDERGHETVEHECSLEAFCSRCDTLLPWPLYQIQELDCCATSEAAKIIEDLLASAEA